MKLHPVELERLTPEILHVFGRQAPAADCRRQDRPEHHDNRLVPVGPAVEPAGLHSLRAARAIYLSIYGVPRLFHRLHPAGGGQKK